jgi:hypothetical protein
MGLIYSLLAERPKGGSLPGIRGSTPTGGPLLIVLILVVVLVLVCFSTDKTDDYEMAAIG